MALKTNVLVITLYLFVLLMIMSSEVAARDISTGPSLKSNEAQGTTMLVTQSWFGDNIGPVYEAACKLCKVL
ncbi:hypothetical protein P3L10_011633 [Capsicum annuum]